jgi:hypothetical protein
MHITARFDAELHAVVTAIRPLHMPGGADSAEDRPAHVRAASGLTAIGDGLAVIQDDASFVVMLDRALDPLRVIPLPRGVGGLRQFDDARGNKHHKPDFESCITVPDPTGPALLLFGSGSTAARESIVAIREPWSNSPAVEVYDARRLYAALHACSAFSGSELNIEGAVCDVGRVRLFNRGNGAARNGLEPVNATVDVALTELLSFLEDSLRADVPALHDVASYDLGDIAGCPLGFTDAAMFGGATVYSAVAEMSPDVTRDGPVLGAAIGIIRGGAAAGASGATAAGGIPRAWWTALQTPDGRPFAGKVEGIAHHPAGDGRLVLVIDHDDHTRPSELAVVSGLPARE